MGFRKKNEPVITNIFVKNEKTYQWYSLDDKKTHVPIYDQEFTGFLQGIKLQFSKPEDKKLKPVLKCFFSFFSDNQRYNIISGINSYFSKKMILSLLLVPTNILCRKELILKISPGDLSIVWVSVFFPITLKDGTSREIEIKIPQKEKITEEGETILIDDLPEYKANEIWEYKEPFEKLKKKIHESIDLVLSGDDEEDDDEGLMEYISSDTYVDPVTGEVKLLNPVTPEITSNSNSNDIVPKKQSSSGNDETIIVPKEPLSNEQDKIYDNIPF